MAKFTLRELELFVAIADHRTLSEAAAALHFSESALSQAITHLERSVGEQLCIRRKAHGSHLTPAGTYFATRARLLLHDVEELVDGLGSLHGQLRGPVKLGCFASVATSVLPPVLAGFPLRHPGVSIDVTVGTHDDLLPALEDGHLDLAILYDLSLPPGLHRRTIYASELQAVLPIDHPLARAPRVDLAELVSEPLIMYDATPALETTLRVFAHRGLHPLIGARVPQVILVLALVGRGLGYGLLMSRPNWTPVTLEGLPVAVRPLTQPASPTTLSGVWAAQSRLSARADALLEFTIEVILAEATRLHRPDGHGPL